MFSSLLRCHHPQRIAALAVVSACHVSHNTTTDAEASRKQKEPKKEELFEGQCLKRQMHQPKLPYPAWDYNWDGRMSPSTSLEGHREGLARGVRGKTRHIILVRHGQYDESSKDDELRKLTPLGRIQATKTGQRLAEWTKGSTNFDDPSFHGPCPIKAIRVSNMTRAKETAQLIANELGGNNKLLFKVETPDPLLNEALPAPMIPIRPDITDAEEEIDENHERIEQAFRKYFCRNTGDEREFCKYFYPSSSSSSIDDDDEDGESSSSSSKEEEDEFEIIVCHGNVIRYFFCRALQLPPEAWLRMSIFNCSLTYLMVRPNGTVSARMLGDIGHLNYEESTFSGYHGLKW